MNEDLYKAALDVASRLRAAGQKVDLVLEPKKTKWVFKYANRIGAKYSAIIGSQEFENGEVAIKNLEASEQESVKIAELAEWVDKQ
mmetsp:Transcript_37332/g.90652  ORF Transcript_37332/g.90652 Transcript_37332/m.90652 type:complete len:86 (+) Transcript_37332:1429-1686(+)